MKIAILCVSAQTGLVAVITVLPISIVGFFGYRSAIIPKGRFDKAEDDHRNRERRSSRVDTELILDHRQHGLSDIDGSKSRRDQGNTSTWVKS